MKIWSLLATFAMIQTSLLVLAGPCDVDSVNLDDIVTESSIWTVETIAIFGGNSPPALAVDSTNRPIILYCPPGEVWLSAREGDAGWKSELVAETVAGGVCGKLSLGPHEEPHLTLPPRVGDPGQMYAFKHEDLWHFEPAPFPVGGLALDSGGVPHAVGIPGFPQQGLLFSRKVNLSWETELVDPFPASQMMIHWESLTLDGNDNPHILYYADTTGDVRYAFRDNGTWSIETVDHIGNIQAVGRQGSLALDSEGDSHAAYSYRVNHMTQPVKYARRGADSWSFEILEPVIGLFPSIGHKSQGTPAVSYVRGEVLDPGRRTIDEDLVFSEQNASNWEIDVVYDGYLDVGRDIHNVPWFPSMVVDKCANPHIAFYLSNKTNSGVQYATKGKCPPEPEEASISLDIDPDTLNLKSKGRWITAYLSAENASVHDVDVSTILLQDALSPERWDYQDDVLMLKFSRQEFKDTVQVGESVEIKLTGNWKDGTAFEAHDHIQVIDPGKG